MNSPNRLVPRAGAGIALAALIVAISFLGARDTAEATSFSPHASVSLADSTPGAVSDVVSSFGIDAPDSNFGAVVSFTPPEFTVPTTADVPIGAIVLQLNADVRLGLLSNPCSSPLVVTFDMMNASTNINDTVLRNNKDDPATNDGFDDVNPANGLPDAVDHYPDHLKRIFPGVQPRARYYGQQDVASGTPVDLNFVIFEPGANISDEFIVDPALGYPSVTVLLDPESPDPPGPSPITDFCSPLLTDITTLGTSKDNLCSDSGPPPAQCFSGSSLQLLRGIPGSGGTTPDESGATVRKNPSAAGTFLFTTFAASQFDADDDGIENGLDPCPLSDADPTWNPRSGSTGDQDQDGLPDSCDPNPTVKSPITVGFDEDQDGFSNRGDNCPLVFNGLVDAQGNPDPLNGDPNDATQADEEPDGIGDACDPDPTVDSGHQHVACVTTEVTVGAGGSAPTAPNVCTADGIGIDVDGNGIFDSLEGGGGGGAGGAGGAGAGGGGAGGAAGAGGGAGGGETTVAGAGTGGTGDTTGGTTGTGGTGGAAGGGAGGPETGVGSLAPVASSIPGWAAIASGLGGAGLLGSLGAFAARIFRRRR